MVLFLLLKITNLPIISVFFAKCFFIFEILLETWTFFIHRFNDYPRKGSVKKKKIQIFKYCYNTWDFVFYSYRFNTNFEKFLIKTTIFSKFLKITIFCNVKFNNKLKLGKQIPIWLSISLFFIGLKEYVVNATTKMWQQ